MNNEYLVKINIIGKGDDLKTTFIESFSKKKIDNEKQRLMLGVDITTKRIDVDNKPVKLIIVDTIGNFFFDELRPR